MSMGLFTSIVEAFRQGRSRKRIRQQFVQAGFIQVECPSPLEMLPIRHPEIIKFEEVALFAKSDMQMLVLPVRFLPRTRYPHRGRTFALMCTPVEADDPTSAALRCAAEKFSIVDQLEMDSYPSISPLPRFTLFASDDVSAQRLLAASYLDLTGRFQQDNSLVGHNGRLMVQVSA
jgi:hypothetical protein